LSFYVILSQKKLITGNTLSQSALLLVTLAVLSQFIRLHEFITVCETTPQHHAVRWCYMTSEITYNTTLCFTGIES